VSGDDDAVIGEFAEDDHCFLAADPNQFGLIWYVINRCSMPRVNPKSQLFVNKEAPPLRRAKRGGESDIAMIMILKLPN
jgi:hypothetical protein